MLLHERLPTVIRIPEDRITGGEVGDSSSFICDETIATMPLSEEAIQLLIQNVAESKCNLPFADLESIRNLASSIMVKESSKKEKQLAFYVMVAIVVFNCQ